MTYMRSTLAYILFWINLIIISISLYITITENIKIENQFYYPDYLRATKEKFKKINPYFFLNEEFASSNHLRNLSFNPKPHLITLLTFFPLLALLLLMISFCVTENECCTNNAEINANFPVGNCFGIFKCNIDCSYCEGGANCNCNQEESNCIVILSLIFFPFTILICTSKACGKHVVRIFSVALLILGYIAMIAIDCFILHEIYAIILIAIYSFGVVINFAGVLFSGLL